MERAATAICDRELTGHDAPEWVHLLPMGPTTARDGRVFDLADPELVLNSFRDSGIDLPIDYEHQSERAEARSNGPVPAAGWIKALAAREDGIWGRVEWTDKARDMISKREYRFLSPALVFNKADRKVMKLKGAGLVHSPALHLTALACQEDDMTTRSNEVLPRIATMLNLPEDAGETAVFDELAKALDARDKPDPRKYVPIEAMSDVMRNRASEAATLSEDRIQAKVSEAFNAGYLTTSVKDWATALCRKDEAAFDDFLKTSAPAYGHLLQPSHTTAMPPDAGHVQSAQMSDVAEAICTQLGIEASALTE